MVRRGVEKLRFGSGFRTADLELRVRGTVIESTSWK